MEGPLEFSEGEGQSAKGNVAVGARVAQTLGLGGQVRDHCGQQVRIPSQRRGPGAGNSGVEVESLAQFESQAAIIQARKTKLKDLRGLTVEVGGLGGGDELEGPALVAAASTNWRDWLSMS